jgi:hypothetical protein
VRLDGEDVEGVIIGLGSSGNILVQTPAGHIAETSPINASYDLREGVIMKKKVQ